MAKVKFDKEKASTLITELTNLQTNINSCLSNINSCGSWKDPYSSDLVVWDTVYYTETNIVDGVSVSEQKSKKVKTYPHTSKVQSYNTALGSIQSKATSLKTTSGKISKVITALKKVSELVEEFENTPNLTLSAELGDAADHNFNFLEKFGGSGSASLKGPMGFLGSVWDRIDITEFNRLGEDIIPTINDEIPEKIIDFDGDGKISISDYMKSYVKDSVNEDGIVVINGQELGELASLTFTTFLTKTDPEFLEEIELGIEQDLHVVVDLAGSLATLAGIPLKPENEGEGGDSESVAGGTLMDSILLGVPVTIVGTENKLNALLSRLDEEETISFNEKTAGMTPEEKLLLLEQQLGGGEHHFGKTPPHGVMGTEVPTTTPEGAEIVVEGAGIVADKLAGIAADIQGITEPPTLPDKVDELEDLVVDDKAYNDVYKKAEDNGYGNGYYGNGGNGGSGNNGGGGHGGGGHGNGGNGGGGHGGGGNGGHTPTTTPQTEAPTQPQTQPVTEAPTQPKTQPVTEPPKHTPASPPKHDEKNEFELISRGDDSSFEMPILKDEVVVEEDKVSSAGAGLLGAAGVGAGLLNGGGNATPAIPSVDLGVTPPPAPVPSTMTTPNTPSTPTTTVQNNTPMAGATPDMDDMIASQNPGVQQGSNTTTHSSRTTADTSSEGITKGKYSSSGNSSSSSTSKQSKDTFTKDGEFKDDKDDNTVQNKVDPTKPEGVLGEASYAELIAKEEKQIKVATAITASSMAVSIALSLASVIDVIVLVLLLLAAILAYSVFRNKKKKNIKRLEALIKIEKIKKEETDAVAKEEVSEENIEEKTETDEKVETENDTEEKTESDKDDTENETEVSKIKEVEEIVTEQKEFQSAEEVIYGETLQRTEEASEQSEETDSTKE